MKKKYTIFELDNKKFAVELEYIREVNPFPGANKLPNIGTKLIGVFNWRGVITTVLNIREVLGLEYMKPREDDMLIVLQTGNLKTGIVVNKISDIQEIEDSQLNRDLSELNEKLQSHGVAVINEIVILDGSKLIRSCVI